VADEFPPKPLSAKKESPHSSDFHRTDPDWFCGRFWIDAFKSGLRRRLIVPADGIRKTCIRKTYDTPKPIPRAAPRVECAENSAVRPVMTSVIAGAVSEVIEARSGAGVIEVFDGNGRGAEEGELIWSGGFTFRRCSIKRWVETRTSSRWRLGRRSQALPRAPIRNRELAVPNA